MSDTVENRIGRSLAFPWVVSSHFFLSLTVTSAVLEHAARDYQALNLGRPFVNLGYLCVAKIALDLELFCIAVAAVDLHRLGRRFHRCLRGKQFRHRGFLGA